MALVLVMISVTSLLLYSYFRPHGLHVTCVDCGFCSIVIIVTLVIVVAFVTIMAFVTIVILCRHFVLIALS